MRRAGFSLIEMLTVVAIFGLVAIYVGRVLTVNERAYHTVENTSESQQNLRVFGELIDDNLRHAGMMVPREAAVCGRDFTNAPDILYVSDAGAITLQDEDSTPFTGPTVDAGPTDLDKGADAADPFGNSATFTLSSLIVEPSPPSRPAYDIDGDGTADSDFRVGSGVIVYAPGNLPAGNACGRITGLTLGTRQIVVEGVADLAGAGGALVVLPANEFIVTGTQLRWNGIILADGIEDFQVAYVFDDGDNVVEAGETRGYNGGTAYASSEFEANTMREVSVAIVSRARQADPAFTGRPQTRLNRTAITTSDNFRRRTFETHAVLRNLATRQGV